MPHAELLCGLSAYSFALLPALTLRFAPDGSWAIHFQFAAFYADLWIFTEPSKGQGDIHGF